MGTESDWKIAIGPLIPGTDGHVKPGSEQVVIIAVSDGRRSFSLVLQWSQGSQEPVGAFVRVSRNGATAESSEGRAQGLGETALQWRIRLRGRQTGR